MTIIKIRRFKYKATNKTVLVKRRGRWVLSQRCRSAEDAQALAQQSNDSEARSDGLFMNWRDR